MAALAALREQGADRVDPMRLRYLEALAARMSGCDGDTIAYLAARFDSALDELAARCAASEGATRAAPAQRAAPCPLAALNRDYAPASPELKAVRMFGKTWARLSVDRQIRQALEKEPDNAGPLNSHLLVLRSLAQMRELSPDYLNRFMAHVDTLLWLDQAVALTKPARKDAAASEAVKKKRPMRGKAR